jgi:hypothetical protein
MTCLQMLVTQKSVAQSLPNDIFLSTWRKWFWCDFILRLHAHWLCFSRPCSFGAPLRYFFFLRALFQLWLCSSRPCSFGNPPAKNTVYTLYICVYMVLANPKQLASKEKTKGESSCYAWSRWDHRWTSCVLQSAMHMTRSQELSINMCVCVWLCMRNGSEQTFKWVCMRNGSEQAFKWVCMCNGSEQTFK